MDCAPKPEATFPWKEGARATETRGCLSTVTEPGKSKLQIDKQASKQASKIDTLRMKLKKHAENCM